VRTGQPRQPHLSRFPDHLQRQGTPSFSPRVGSGMGIALPQFRNGVYYCCYMESGRGLAVGIACLLVAIATDRAHAQIHFDDFASSEGLSLVGDARVSGKVL